MNPKGMLRKLRDAMRVRRFESRLLGTRCAFEDRAPGEAPIEVVERLGRALGSRGGSWEIEPLEDAIERVAKAAAVGMAYGNRQMQDADAVAFVLDFCRAVGLETATAPGPEWSCWMAEDLDLATFDRGLVLVGPSRAGILWITDED